MKKLIFLLLLTSGAYAQEQVFNVQKYCIDETPFKNGQCDISGDSYSFVFLDAQKKVVVFFLTDTKMRYKIVNAVETPEKSTVYTLQDETGLVEMKVNKGKTQIEFLLPTNHIYLTVGKSTKLGT